MDEGSESPIGGISRHEGAAWTDVTRVTVWQFLIK